MNSAMTSPCEMKKTLLYQGAANAVSCDVVSLKNFEKGWIWVIHSGANDTDLTLSLYQATDVAAGTNKAVTTGCPNWLDADAGTGSDVLAKQADAYALMIDPATQNAVVWCIQIDPAILDVANGYDCIYLADSGGHASNFCTIFFEGVPKYAGATLPSAIVD